MRIRMNDRRDRLYETLMETAPVGTKSGAIDEAARFYCRMLGHNAVEPGQGAFRDLMHLADEQGSVTAEEIAEILNTQEVPVDASTRWSVGREQS